MFRKQDPVLLLSSVSSKQIDELCIIIFICLHEVVLHWTSIRKRKHQCDFQNIFIKNLSSSQNAVYFLSTKKKIKKETKLIRWS